MSKPRPWAAYALRVLTCVLLLATGYGLLSTSTFAARMRDDVPSFVPGLSGIDGLCFVLALVLSILPLVAGRRFLRAFLVSAFLFSGIGGYWWTTIPWEDFVKESGFTLTTPPSIMDFALVASPVLLAVFYVAASRMSLVRADLRARGVDEDEASRAAGASFLVGAAALVASMTMSVLLWVALARGWLLAAPRAVTGVPAVLIAAVLVALAWGLVSLKPRAAEERDARGDVAPRTRKALG